MQVVKRGVVDEPDVHADPRRRGRLRLHVRRARRVRRASSGERSRLSFPLTWGGLEARRRRVRSHVRSAVRCTRIEFGVGDSAAGSNPGVRRRRRSRGACGRAPRRALGPLRARRDGRLAARVVRRSSTTTSRTFGGDVTFDTRLDPVLPRNAVYATATSASASVRSTSGGAIDRTRLDGARLPRSLRPVRPRRARRARGREPIRCRRT